MSEVQNDDRVISTTTESNIEPERHCWVCFATEEDDATASWVRPCFCKGTSKWVHQKCLQRWVDEKQKGNPLGKVACPQCNTIYIIVYPDMGPVVYFLDAMNSAIYKICPFLAAGLMVGSVYWVAVTYGAVTIMQIMGQEEGQELLEVADPLFLLVMLPAIPITLILGKMIQWEDVVLSFVRRNAHKVPLLKHILPTIPPYASDVSSGEPEPIIDRVSAVRVLCSALIFPTTAALIGNIFFRSVKPHIQRTALGAIAFIVVKGVFKLYHKQQMYVRQSQRTILDFDPELSMPKPVSPQT